MRQVLNFSPMIQTPPSDGSHSFIVFGTYLGTLQKLYIRKKSKLPTIWNGVSAS